MATPLFRPSLFKWCTASPLLVLTKGEWGDIVNLSGGHWGRSVSVKRSTSFKDIVILQLLCRFH